MATTVMDRLGRVFISLQQIKQLPLLLTQAAPSVPGTVKDKDVPAYFRERYVLSGYRPLHQSWRYYVLSLFQRHNETVNVWTHLLAFLVFLLKLCQITESVDFVGDPHSWPLLILILSAMTYSGLSATAHLLGGKSELCHYTFFFLDYVGVAQYQYGSAVSHFYYGIDEVYHGRVSGFFMAVASCLSCLSCFGCCYGKYRNHSLPTWVRKVGQVVPSCVAYTWDCTPLMGRFLSWSSAADDPAIVYHFGQVSFFLCCAVFFSVPVPESCCPGRCDFLGHSHQVFHFFLSCCTLSQIHASYLDYETRRQLYSSLHQSGDAAFCVGLYMLTLACCLLTAAGVLRKTKRVIDKSQ